MSIESKLLNVLDEFAELGIDKQVGFNKFYLCSLITHSTAIEGSTVTEIENQLLFDEGISAKGRSMNEQMIASYKKSIEQGDVPVNVPVKLSKRQASIMGVLRLRPETTASELAVKLGVSDKTIKRDIAQLKSEGHIVRIGSDKSGKWQVK